jgi:predicted component of type VI protein secretion system
MSRRTPSLLALVLLVVALTAACAESIAPEPAAELRADVVCERNSNGTCL